MNNSIVGIKDFKLCASSFRCYQQLRVVDDINDSRSHDLKLLDAMNNSILRMI